MKVKTATLIGPALAWAVSIVTIPDWAHNDRLENMMGLCQDPYRPDIDWAQAGPIIDQEAPWVRESAAASPAIAHLVTPDKKWFAYTSRRYEGGDFHCYYGETFLIAAMRCVVASKLGVEIEVPDELLDLSMAPSDDDITSAAPGPSA